jgi:predicted PurR-regulated permease PerM
MTTKRAKQPENQPKNSGFDYRFLLVAGAVAGLLYLLMPILSPFIVAIVLAYVGHPMVDKLSELKLGTYTLGRGIAAFFVISLMTAALLLVIFIVTPLFQNELLLFIQRIPDLIEAAKSVLGPWLKNHIGISIDIDAIEVQSALNQNLKAASQDMASFILNLSTRGLAVISWLGNAILIPVVLFYLIRDWHKFINRVTEFIPRRYTEQTSEITSEIDRVLSGFLHGELIVMLVMSVFYAGGLWFTGLDLAIPIGVMTGLLIFIPYLGFGMGFSLALLVGALQYGNLSDMVPMLIVFGIGQFLESFILTPLWIGERIGLHPAVVLFALLACGQLFGFVGLFFALPLSASIAVGLKYAEAKYFKSDAYLK